MFATSDDRTVARWDLLDTLQALVGTAPHLLPASVVEAAGPAAEQPINPVPNGGGSIAVAAAVEDKHVVNDRLRNKVRCMLRE